MRGAVGEGRGENWIEGEGAEDKSLRAMEEGLRGQEKKLVSRIRRDGLGECRGGVYFMAWRRLKLRGCCKYKSGAAPPPPGGASLWPPLKGQSLFMKAPPENAVGIS